MSDKEQLTTQTFYGKRKDAEAKLAKVFVAFVPVRRRKDGPNGYLFYSAPKPSFLFLNPNFQTCAVGISSGQMREVEELFRNCEAEIRSSYSEKDFHAATATAVLAQYSALMLEWKEKPQAFFIEAVSIDCAGTVTVQGYDGDYTPYEGGIQRVGKIFMAGCYDEKIKAAVMEVFQEEIRGEKLSSVEVRGIIRTIQTITGNKFTGCAAL